MSRASKRRRLERLDDVELYDRLSENRSMASKELMRKILLERTHLKLLNRQKVHWRRELVNSLGLDESDLDSEYDYEYSDTVTRTSHTRNGESFSWPAGWKKLGLDVSQYNQIDRRGNDWLNKRNGWHVAFHGTAGDNPSTIRDIVRNGFKVRGGRMHPRNGEAYGEGIYCTPEIDLATKYAKPPLTIGGRSFEIVFQVRVHPGYFEEHINAKIMKKRNPHWSSALAARRIWVVEGGDAPSLRLPWPTTGDCVSKHVRPCAILYREIDTTAIEGV